MTLLLNNPKDSHEVDKIKAWEKEVRRC